MCLFACLTLWLLILFCIVSCLETACSPYALVNVNPRGGGSGGQTHGNLTFSRVPKSNSPPLGTYKTSYSRPWVPRCAQNGSQLCQIPHPWAPTKRRILAPGYRVVPKTGLSYVKFPTPGHLQNVEFSPLGTALCPKQVLAMSNSRPQGRARRQNPHPEKSAFSQFPVCSLPPQPWPKH